MSPTRRIAIPVALVEEDLGHATALAVARRRVVFLNPVRGSRRHRAQMHRRRGEDLQRPGDDRRRFHRQPAAAPPPRRVIQGGRIA